ncbi:HAUS augmin-like complex subunit 6 [Halichoeres trimaculatus]|uniref:HAUS augmin-like complex subunit 6 n=1 Tax=Halichoeres trimaculatus TaxID=147232 RepID=UPI003D9DFF63
MANPVLLQKKNGKYLWFSLLGLGFQPDTAMATVAGKTNINVKHINLGPNMFDKPNKDAFYIVTHFLLLKLNPARFNEAYRHCWPILDHKADAEFRKVTCAWLREIMDETANAGSKVVASLFLSPGGPKFVSLMLHLANHVMLQEMKTFTTDDSWVPEVAAVPASSFDMAMKRLNPVYSRFLRAAVDQDRFLHEYQKRTQVLVKSKRDAREEGARYDELLKRFNSDVTQEGASAAEKTKRVRSLWSTIDEMLSSTSGEQQAVESVLKGDVDQHILDGTNRVIKIPRTLLERVEQLPNQLSSGNVYESGQLNLLSVLELTNHSLQLLREERCQVSQAPKPQIGPKQLQEKCQQMSRVLQDLHLIRQKISKEGIPEVRGNIRELEAEWDRRWMDTLKDVPLVSFLDEDPALGFLSPMAPLSFEPAADASYRSSIFSQFSASLLEEKPAESKVLQPDSSPIMSPSPETAETIEDPVVTAVASSRANTSLDWLLDTPPAPPVTAPSAPPPQASVRKTARVRPKAGPTKNKSQILNMECDNLADQFADAVTTTSPSDSRVRGLDLEGLLSTLHGDPFSTRKQLARTPESLIRDVKSSWRKALEEDEAEKRGRSEKFEDPTMGRLTPLNEPSSVSLSPESSKSATSTTKQEATSHSPPVSQQELRATLLWDTFETQALDTPSGTGSSAVMFSLAHETLPEMPSCDSLLSLDDEALDTKSEDDDLSLPSLKTEGKCSPLNALQHLSQLQQAGDGSFMESRKAPECLLTGHAVPTFDKDWLMTPAKSNATMDKVFSLDLDTLGTPPPKKQDLSLPKLITFSPIDDMKC